MASGSRNSLSCTKNDRIGTVIPDKRAPSRMGKQDRKMVVLGFLAELGLALPQGAIYRNLCIHHGITFGYGAIDNYLDEFVEDGYCRRLDPEALEERELADMPRGKHNRAYYIITDAGRDHVRGY